MAVDVTATQRSWYSSYKNKIVSAHARTGHWTPENDYEIEHVKTTDANGDVFPVGDGLVIRGGK